MRHSKFILKRDLTLRHSTSLQQFSVVSVWVGVTQGLLAPDSAGLPGSGSLPPTTCASLGWQWGRDGAADSGHQALYSHQEDTVPGRMCPQRAIWLPSALSLCTGGRGVGRGRGSCQKAHVQGALALPTSDSRLAAWGEWGHLFPLGWVPVRARAQGGFVTMPSDPSAHSWPPWHGCSRQ